MKHSTRQHNVRRKFILWKKAIRLKRVMWMMCLWLVDTLDSCADHSLWKHCSSNSFSHTKRFIVCVDWKTLCCAHQFTNKKEDAVSCWRWWSLFLELLFPAIIEYLSKRIKKNTAFLRALIHSVSFSCLFTMWLLAEWKYQEPSNSRKKRNKRNILKEKIFCKFNGLWQFGIALLSDAFFVTEHILLFSFLLK